MNKDGELACLLAYEWTPNEYKYDYGHKNVYYRGDEGEIFRSGDKGGMTPTDLYNSIRSYKALCIPHHPAADWVMVSAATDWNFHDPEVQRAVEIYSRHAPFETFEARSKFTKNIKKMERCSVQDALARGYRMASPPAATPTRPSTAWRAALWPPSSPPQAGVRVGRHL